MARVDFYSLPTAEIETGYRFLLPLLTKILEHGQQAHIHCRDAAETSYLDDLLWNLKLTSFLPHHCLDKHPSGQAPVSQ